MAIQLSKRLFTVEEFHRMAQAGILTEDDRVELLEGEILAMSPIGTRHAACMKRLIRLFDRSVGDGAIVAAQDPIQLAEHSEPQPDLAVLTPRDDFYSHAHPGPSDILLLIEVAETSAETDRDVKLPLYARSGILEVWLVNLADEGVEIYRQPSPVGYRERRTVQRGDHLTPQALPGVDLAVADVLG